MKRQKNILGIILCLLLILTGCTLGDGEAQITKLNSKYVQTEETKQNNLETGQGDSEDKESQSSSEGEQQKEVGEDGKDSVGEEEAGKNRSEKEVKASSEDKRDTESAGENTSQRKNSKKNTTQEVSKEKNKVKNSNTQKKSNTLPDKANEDKEQTDKKENNKEEIATSSNVCTISIDCKTILDNKEKLNSAKKEFVPEDGWILKATKVSFEEGDTVYDILYRICRESKIQMEASYTPAYKTYYVEGINQLYEFDCGDLSGWTFLVNGVSLNYGCSKYTVKAGDVICWRFSCNAGRDVK